MADELRRLPEDVRRQRINSLDDEEALALWHDWEFWCRDDQRVPESFANALMTYWLILAGRGYGKTRVGAEQCRKWSHNFPLINLIGATADDARDIMIEGESGILAVCPKDERPLYVKGDRKLKWPSGAISLIFTADEPERLRGKQHMKLWADELGAWRYVEAWDQAQFGLRLGAAAQAIVTTTPRPTKIIKELSKSPDCVTTRGTTYTNRANLAKAFFTAIIKKYEGTRLGRQELNAELLEDNPNALWKQADIDADRLKLEDLPRMMRIVVAIDPNASSNKDSDEAGIVAVGKFRMNDEDHYAVLDDQSDIYSPDQWANVACQLYHKLGADRIVGESNNGGEMVQSTIRHSDPDCSFRMVYASRGKYIRAEPISALAEQHRIHHIGMFAKLEDQLTNWNPKIDSRSPDRLDAYVWAITELCDGGHGLIDAWGQKVDEMHKDASNDPLPATIQSKEEKEETGFLRSLPTTVEKAREKAMARILPKGAVTVTTACPGCGNTNLSRYSEGAWACHCGVRGRDERIN